MKLNFWSGQALAGLGCFWRLLRTPVPVRRRRLESSYRVVQPVEPLAGGSEPPAAVDSGMPDSSSLLESCPWLIRREGETCQRTYVA